MMKQALLFSEDDGILYLCNKLKMGRGNMGVKGGRPGQIPKGGREKSVNANIPGPQLRHRGYYPQLDLRYVGTWDGLSQQPVCYRSLTH